MVERPRKDAGGAVFEAAKVADLGGGPAVAGFVYSVRIKGADRRRAQRRRTRLRSGKILDLANVFMIEWHASADIAG
jgi:hypothetical protein